jgi:hypothetical protein
MTVLIAATVLMSPLVPIDAVPSNTFVVGAAVYYSPSYDRGGWRQIVQRRKDWGQLSDDWELPVGMYYCAHPDAAIGTVIQVQNVMTGTIIECVVVDQVAPRDIPNWKQHAVIELSWSGFCAVDGRQVNRVVVTQEGRD